MTDRIKIIYEAIDEMANAHGIDRPNKFGGGIWNFDEEIEIWKKQILGNENIPLTKQQWTVINSYIKLYRIDLGLLNE